MSRGCCGMIILKTMSKNYDVREWIVFICLRIGYEIKLIGELSDC
jgi:hypothetical protein